MDELERFMEGVDETNETNETEETEEMEEIEETEKKVSKKMKGSKGIKKERTGKREKGDKDEKNEKNEKKGKKEKRPPRDNIAYVQNMRSIQGVRRFHQIALAKKAKSAGKPNAIERYDREIEAAKARLETLIEEAKKNGNTLQGLIDLDEELNKVITYYISIKEAEFDKWVEDNGFKVPKSILKSIEDSIPAEFLDELPLDLHEELFNRFEKSDFRLRALCRRFNFVSAVESGKLVNQEGKWIRERE